MHRQKVAYAMGVVVMAYDEYDSPSVVGVDSFQPVSSSVSADSAEQTSGVDSPNLNQETTLLYSHSHTGTCMYICIYVQVVYGTCIIALEGSVHAVRQSRLLSPLHALCMYMYVYGVHKYCTFCLRVSRLRNPVSVASLTCSGELSSIELYNVTQCVCACTHYYNTNSTIMTKVINEV